MVTKAVKKRGDITKEISSSRGQLVDITDKHSSYYWLSSRDKLLLEKSNGTPEIYEDLFNDYQITSGWGQRAAIFRASEVVVSPGGSRKADETAAKDLEKQLKAIQFDSICGMLQYAKFYGYAVAEVMYAREGNGRVILDPDRGGFRVRNRRRFRFNRDHELRLLDYFSMADGVKLPDRKFWVVSAGADNSDEPYGRGLGAQLYWLRHFKVDAFKWWILFLEKFADPTTVYEYLRGELPGEPGSLEQESAIQKLADKAAVSARQSGVAIPEGAKLTLLEAQRSGVANYSDFVAYVDKSISKCINGQTMTADDGSSFSQAQIHEKILLDNCKDDVDMICQSANTSWVRWLTDWNYGGRAAYPTINRVIRPEPDLLKMAERDEILAVKLALPLTPEHYRETYGDIFIPPKEVANEISNLNGEQGKTLMDIVDRAKTGTWSAELTEAVLKAMLPTISIELVDVIKKDIGDSIEERKQAVRLPGQPMANAAPVGVPEVEDEGDEADEDSADQQETDNQNEEDKDEQD
jgi:phage gp29-like protein